MRFKYVGQSTIRIIEPYIWNKENDYIQDVSEPELIENLLTYPSDDFQPLDEVSFVEGDSRTADELKAKKARRKPKKSKEN